MTAISLQLVITTPAWFLVLKGSVQRCLCYSGYTINFGTSPNALSASQAEGACTQPTYLVVLTVAWVGEIPKTVLTFTRITEHCSV